MSVDQTAELQGKRVLVTGHTGFKGSWLTMLLHHIGAEVAGFALDPYSDRDGYVVSGVGDHIIDVRGDLRDFEALNRVFDDFQPEIVFHLGAQALVGDSYGSPKETYDINVGGTTNVLECARLSASVRVIIVVTSDKCYENLEWAWPYRENDALGGHDPYSTSKAAAELVTQGYRRSFFCTGVGAATHKAIATVRAGNVVGGGDWRAQRLIPDCIRALERHDPIEVRHPRSIRPWQHVLEPLNGYLTLASLMYGGTGDYCGVWNFGPDAESMRSVGEVASLVVGSWGEGSWIDTGGGEFHEASMLRLDATKARVYLGWRPIWGLEETISKTVEWYRTETGDTKKLLMKQIVDHRQREASMRGGKSY